MNTKTFISSRWQQLTVLMFCTAVFCYWLMLYPFVLITRETAQLFLWNSSYLLERLAIPGGIAQYVAEFLVQFFNNPFNGACIYALLCLLAQWLSCRILRREIPAMGKGARFAASLLLPAGIWFVATITYIPLTPTIAVLLALVVMAVLPQARVPRLISLCVLIPVVYWLVGPAVVLLLLCCVRWIPLTAVILAVSVWGSSYLAHYPLRYIVRGLDYCWDQTKQMGTNEEMECDMLVRMKRWDTIIRKFPKQQSPAVRCAVLLAMHKTGDISREQLYQQLFVPSNMQGYAPSVFNIGTKHLIVNYGSLASAFMVSDIALEMHYPNIAQRAAFDAMEFIPNYNKSGRALRRMVETALVTGQYPVAKKYTFILEQTILYRDWAYRMRTLTDHPEQIKEKPFFQQLKEDYANTEDLFFI